MTDTAEDGTRLHRLLGGESTAWLVRRARDRLEAGRPLTGTVTLTGATVEQRRAVERLTGRAPRSGSSLDLLAVGGAEFRYHGDFDWGGIRIARAVCQRVGQEQSHWQPWRYDRNAYEAAATAVLAVHAATRLPRPAGEPVATPWDPGLAAAMACHDVRMEEELSLDALLADLA